VENEIEGALFPNINAMGVQFHPEMMSFDEPGHKMFLSIVINFLSLSKEHLIAKYKSDNKVQMEAGK
jgi:gamma-glutamyl-gamma-aminobutyrate hydrolase PuuD